MAWLTRGCNVTWSVNRHLRIHRTSLHTLSLGNISRVNSERVTIRLPNVRLIHKGAVNREKPVQSSAVVRRTFIEYFKGKDHLHIPSSSIVSRPGEGTYFTNAGMNQFKPIFLGTVDPGSEMSEYKRAVNSQRCVRVGGKHNDLDDVGKDTSHHTFFEMLGSWSFGDYFKEAACKYAWQLLTEQYQIPAKHLYVTYFGGDDKLNLPADLECRDLWLELGVPSERVIASGAVDNFWDMGDTGPCGPCTEIHYAYNGNGKQAHLVNTDNPSVLEIWNLVFMQFDRQADGSLKALPNQHVDTGMGLERISAVLQGLRSNYDTDLFTPIFRHIHYNCSCPPYEGRIMKQDSKGVDTAYRIVADHMRMVTVALADGVRPGNKDQGSKVRQIFYRALKQSKDILRAPPFFLSSLVPVVIDTLGDAFPTSPLTVDEMQQIIDHSELKIGHMEKVVARNLKKALDFYGNPSSLTDEQVVEIHEGRFGNTVNIDVLEEICHSKNIGIDVDSVYKNIDENKIFQIPVHEQSERTQMVLDQHHVSWLQEQGTPITDDSYKYKCTSDDGAYTFPPIQSNVLAILCNGEFVGSVKPGDRCGVVLKESPFYSEAGGQIADIGYMRTSDGSTVNVDDAKSSSGYVLHTSSISKGTLQVGDAVLVSVNQGHRQACMCNHTGTHIVNYALEKVLGKVQQQGSLVSPHKFTFDFSCSNVSIDFNDIREVSETANALVHENLPVYKEQVHLDTALCIPGLRTLQDEVYPKQVRVVSIGAPVDCLMMPRAEERIPSHCVELCGGTHVENTGDIEALVITNVKGLTQGTRRITAVTGSMASQAIEDFHELKLKLSHLGNDILANRNHTEWRDRANYIEKRLSDGTLLPKLERDALVVSLDQIKHRVFSQSKNISVKEKLAEQIQMVLGLHTSHSPLVVEFPFEKARDMAAVLASLELRLPAMFLSPPGRDAKKTKQLVFGLCYVPEDSPTGFTAKSWAQHVARNSGGTFHDPKGKLSKKAGVMQILSFPASESAISQAKDLALTFANLYFER